jgi:hypothetical protein
MGIKSIIGLSDELAVKALLAASRFVSSDKQGSSASWIEGKSQPPNSTGGIEAHLLHVGVARSIERIYTWPPKLRAKLFNQASMGEDLVLHLFGQFVKLGLELLTDFDSPGH